MRFGLQRREASLAVFGLAAACSSFPFTGAKKNGSSPNSPPPAAASTEQTAATAAANAATAPSSNSSALTNNCAGVVDACPVKGGVTWQCKTRFMTGVNYAWHAFGADFGGMAAWSQSGIAATASIDAELADMKAQGASVVRWWVFPDLRGDGVQFDAAGTPTGLGGTFSADFNTALQLAAKHDLYLMLTIFSFDAFNPTKTDSGATIRGLQPIALDAAKTQALIANVIEPMAALAEASPNRARVLAWDIINEPEWAVSGPSLYGDQDFTPTSGLQTLTHAQMESFVGEVAAGLRAKSHALVTVGGAAMKWQNAWTHLNLDFYQFHTYDWINQYWPYDHSPTQYGITDKPVVMGEFPLTGLTGVSTDTLLSSWLSNGYAGALGWSVTDPTFNWSISRASLAQFAQSQPCELSY